MSRPRQGAEPYLIGAATTVCALLLRVPVWNVLGLDFPFLTFFPAVALASHLQGWRAGVTSALLSAIASLYFLIPPINAFALTSLSQLTGMIYFCGICALLIWSAEALRNARHDAEAQRRLVRQTLASIGDGVITTGTREDITFINPVAEQLTGWTVKDALGKPIHEVFRIAGEDTGNTILTTRDGTTVPIDDSGAPIRDRQGRIVGAVLVFRDITQRHEADKRMHETERQLTQLAKSDVIGVLFGHIDGGVRDANNEFLRMTGRTRAELEAGALNWRAITPPEYRDVEDRALAEARERGACTPYEKEYLRPDGTRVPVLIGYILLEPDREHSVAFIADLTERRKAEEALRSINDDLQLFTYGTSHDLKEPLRMVASYSQLLARKYAGRLDGDADEYLRFIALGVERMRALVDALLEYSRAGEVFHEPSARTNAGAALGDSLLSLRAAIEESGAEIVSEELPDVCADHIHLTQVFQNLIGNAIKYAGPEAPRIDVRAAQLDGMCRFTVEDNGPGIEPQHHERVFAAFQRLHGRERSGTGLGLATCRRIVERYGGRIWVESAGDGSGSRFHFTLPAAG